MRLFEARKDQPDVLLQVSRSLSLSQLVKSSLGLRPKSIRSAKNLAEVPNRVILEWSIWGRKNLGELSVIVQLTSVSLQAVASPLDLEM